MSKDEITRVQRLHHNAYVCKDQEETRAFYEDTIGVPLVATWIEEEELNGALLNICHTFYKLQDGSSLAFFSFKEKAHQDMLAPHHQSLFVHLALKVDLQTRSEIKSRLQARDHSVMDIEHGYCSSIYVVDPNGLTLEFAVDHADIEQIELQQTKTAHEDLQRWQRGDFTINNHLRS